MRIKKITNFVFFLLFNFQFNGKIQQKTCFKMHLHTHTEMYRDRIIGSIYGYWWMAIGSFVAARWNRFLELAICSRTVGNAAALPGRRQ